jgi:hypothetical protein
MYPGMGQAQDFIGLEQALRDIAQQTMLGPGGVIHLVDAVLRETVKQLKGHTSEMRPPIKPGGPLRPAHLGHWADRTKVLVGAYRHEVHGTTYLVEGLLINDDPGGYGRYLDERGAFFVLRGVMDPGGPVVKVLAETVPRFPGWSWMGA